MTGAMYAAHALGRPTFRPQSRELPAREQRVYEPAWCEMLYQGSRSPFFVTMSQSGGKR